MRKNLILVFVLAGIAILVCGVVLWFLFFAGKSVTVPFFEGSVFPEPRAQEMGGGDIRPNDGGGGESVERGVTKTPEQRGVLWQVTKVPTAGSVSFATTTGEQEYRYIRFVERERGHVYDHDLATRQTKKISNTTVLSVSRAEWFPGSAVALALQTTEPEGMTVSTFSGTLVPRSPVQDEEDSQHTITHEIVGDFMESNILSFVLTPSGEIVYTVHNQTGTTIKTQNRSRAVRTIFSTPLREIILQDETNGGVTLLTKPSRYAPGFFFLLPLSGNILTRIAPSSDGIVASLNRGGTTVLYTSHFDGGTASFIAPPDGSPGKVTPLLFIPDKCVWSRQEKNMLYCATPTLSVVNDIFPDQWYQGKISFTDFIYKFNADTFEATLLASPADFRSLDASFDRGIDATRLTLGANETILTFIDKKTSSLWAIDLTVPR